MNSATPSPQVLHGDWMAVVSKTQDEGGGIGIFQNRGISSRRLVQFGVRPVWTLYSLLDDKCKSNKPSVRSVIYLAVCMQIITGEAKNHNSHIGNDARVHQSKDCNPTKVLIYGELRLPNSALATICILTNTQTIPFTKTDEVESVNGQCGHCFHAVFASGPELTRRMEWRNLGNNTHKGLVLAVQSQVTRHENQYI